MKLISHRLKYIYLFTYLFVEYFFRKITKTAETVRASRSALTSVLPTDHTSNYLDLAYLKRITKPTPIARPESARIKHLERKEATIGIVSARVGRFSETSSGMDFKQKS